jgi:hypothetical protein
MAVINTHRSTHDDAYSEALRIVDAAQQADLTLRLLGGVAVRHLCPTISDPRLSRVYKDIDLVGLASQRAAIQRFFAEHGYLPQREFNLLHGGARLLFVDEQRGRQIDIFLDQFQMCHTFDLRERLRLQAITLTPADLVLTKLQVVEATENDLRDLFALFSDLALGNASDEIDSAYLARLAGRDWGIYRTLTLSLERATAWAAEYGQLGRFVPSEPMARLRAILEREPKSIVWKIRAGVGDRVRWYETPEEVE